MASSSTPPSTATTLTKKHEVFISFRGEDTRQGFTSHLYDALCRKQIKTFIDNKLERGDEISPALLRAIEESKFALVIFSENFASSKWCLRELAEIIKCRKLNKNIVMPVFYNVDPSDVRKLTGSFKCSFEKELQEEVQKWREALTEASNLSGWDSSVIRPDSKLVSEIVEDVNRKLINEYVSTSSDFKGLVGIHKRIEKVMSLLCLDTDDVRIVGIWGMGGIGKTTVARAVSKFISCKFDGACFIENAGKRLENGGSNHVQLKALSEVLHEENLKLSSTLTIHPFIMETFNQKKVLIVLDDLNNFLQSETLVDCLNRCGLGSRIIITSRDKQVFHNFNVDDREIYEVEGFKKDEALELFRKYAFKTNNPTEDFMVHSRKIVRYAKGNPLALKVLGSSLKGKSKPEWESALDKLQGIVNSGIFDVLKISYDRLMEEEKSLFLDIACFNDIIHPWYDGIKELVPCEYSLSVLEAKSLIEDEGRKILMHDLLKEMGREIVRRESPKNPGNRSRLWERDDGIRTLKNNTGTDAVEGIFVDISNLKDDVHLSNQIFDKMHNLRFLIFNDDSLPNKVHLPNGLNYLPDELRILLWPTYPLKSLPSNFNPEKLVKLELLNSNIEQLWEGTKHAPKLKKLFIIFCPRLTWIPDLLYFPSLEDLNLSYCSSLVDFPSVQQLNNIERVNIKRLCLRETAIEEVPSSIQSLTNLIKFDLSKCKKLKHISTSICKLKSLEYLNLEDCSELETFPEILETMEILKSLNLNGTAIKELHPSIEHLNGLRRLVLSNCKNLGMLPSSICNLTSLEVLRLCNCTKLHKLPENFGHLKSMKYLFEIPEDISCLSSLKVLQLSGNMFESLPQSIKHLSKLEILSVRDCNLLRSLTELPVGLHVLEAINCEQLCQALPDASEFKLCNNSKKNHVRFLFTNCFNLNHKAVSNVIEESLKGSEEPTQFCIFLPGSEIPEWFSYQSSGFSVNIQVFRQDLVNRKLTGFAICAVLETEIFYPHNDFFWVNVYCYFETYESYIRTDEDFMRTFDAFIRIPLYCLRSSKFRRVVIDSDHIFLGYSSFSEFGSLSQNLEKLIAQANNGDYVDISFAFETTSAHSEVKYCAVHPIYAEPIKIIGATIEDIGETSGRRSG